MRYSKQRENILNGLKDFCIHPTAEELYMHLKPENKNLSLATVYRNLNQLSANGDIKRIEGLSGRVHFDLNTHEHFHIICEQCGKIMDLPAQMAESMKEILSAQNDFKVKSYDIIVKGLCNSCK